MFKRPAGMPQNTAAMTDRSTQWTQPERSHHQQPNNTDSYKVQRIDSYGTSSSSHEPQSSFSVESPFDFNQPTPSDHHNGAEFLVPELDGPFWQDHYIEDEGSMLNDFDVSNQTMEVVDPLHPHSSGLASHKISLPSPQLTNTSTPEAMGHSHSKQQSQSSRLTISPRSTRSHGTERHHASDSVDAVNPGNLQTPIRSPSHVTSPRIHISSHPRGDSPARSDFQQARLNKKRSASNLSQGEYFPDTQSDMLNVPQHVHVTAWEEAEEETHDRSGVSPAQRGNEEHPSLADMQQKEDSDKNVAEVQGWLQDISLHPVVPRYARGSLLQDRVRSRSTGARPRIGQRPILKITQMPGPGLVIDERSDYYYSSDEESNLSLEAADHPVDPKVVIPPDDEQNIVLNDEVAPLSSEHYRPGPWRDAYPVKPPTDGRRYQPESSNLAMQKFNARAIEFDALSRSATWGTTTTIRRLSDGDQDSVLEVGKTRHYSLSSKARMRGSSIIGKVKGSIKRSSSRGRKDEPEYTAELRKVRSPEPLDDGSSTESQTKPSRPSISKAKSPSISSALRDATGSLAAVGAGPASLNINTSPQPHSENRIKKALGRVRRRSDVNRSPRSPVGLRTMLTQEGGMPVPNLASPGPEELDPMSYTQTPISTGPMSQLPTPSPITMALSPMPANVVPNLEGFKIQIKELNLMLDDFLVNRTAYDQVRRYKRLVKNRVEHIQACAEGRCPSGPLCSNLSAEPEVLLPRSSGNDTSNVAGQFKLPDSDDDGLFDGIVTAAVFPEGIPLPPTKKLPAKFECPLCFQVKTFQKPSDWTKHVHEDVQPFTCTFEECNDPKSFKRKADWVRHENERHRHLEWWRCNINECSHQCFRKDNFVQHLVREHKRKEPKPNRRTNSNAKGKAKSTASMPNQEEQEFWQLVDDCRHESTLDPRKEPCPFCHNTCTSWKKLSVHVGKHMEQIAMPVLGLVAKRNVSKDTVISPVEPLPINSQSYNMNEVSMYDLNTHLSPFSPSNPSYANSSAEQSPYLTYHRVLPRSNMVMSPAGDIPTSYHNQISQTTMDPSYIYHNPISGITYDGFTQAHANPYNTFGDQILFQTPRHITTSEQVPHTMATYADFHTAYEGQSQFLASPEQQFSQFQMGNVMLPNQGTMHMQTPVTSHPMGNGTYIPQQQDSWHQ